MPKQIVIAEQQQVAAIFSEDRIEELVVANSSQQVHDIFLGTVETVIPGIDAAFVNIGDAERNGFMHVTDLGPLKLKRSGAITELLAPQQKVVVQIVKEPTGNKGPRLTGNITLPGRYLVLMPYSKGVSLSRHIEGDSERGRLRALAILIKPAGMGLIVRTEAEEQSEDDIIKDLESLKQQWESIQQQANVGKPPTLLNRDDDFVQRVLRDIYTAEVNRVVIDTAAGLKRVKQQLATWSGGRMPAGVSVEHHRDRHSVLEYFRINAAIREAIKPRVDLPSGGYIIIEPTEALTVVDVNSGSFTRSATSRETVLWTNCEAAVEIARQLRLRKIGGVIVIDFIDMDSRRDQLKVLEIFGQALKTDKARPQIVQMSELGLIELTRKRQGQSLYEVFGRPCPSCGGLGHLAQLPGASEVEALAAAPAAGVPAAKVVSLPSPAERRAGNLDRLVATPAAPEDGELEAELLHHPSYQEQSGSGNRRRRRRNEPTASRTEPAGKGRQRGGNGGSNEGGRRANAEVPPPHQERDRKAEPSPAATPAPEEAATEVVAYKEATTEPTKTIAVPMTPFEQDIYAVMGLSPTIRLDDTDSAAADLSRAVVIAVDPDASEADLAAIGLSLAQVATATADGVSALDPAEATEDDGDGVRNGGGSEISEEVADREPETEATAEMPAIDARESIAIEPEAPEPALAGVAEESSAPRRRRRRSSATRG